MSIFNISDVTPAGAYCNALAAARDSDRRAARHQVSASFESAKVARTNHTSLSAIRAAIDDVLRHIGWPHRTEAA